jgi:ABC-type phosphate/phosphonate transport system substrate-binding protein
MIINTRMYSVCPAAKSAWQTVIEWVTQRADVHWTFLDWDAPKPLSELWARDDLGCAMMCGLPYSLREPQAQIIAAPVLSLARYAGRSVYFSDLAVRADSKYQTLEDTYGGVLGYTLKDSQSGYFALRHHLLPLEKQGPLPFRQIAGNLINPKGVIQALIDGRIDVGPLDSYCHDLFRKLQPELASQVRVVASTDPTPMPPLVSTAALDAATLQRVRDAFLAVAQAPELAAARDALLIERFVVPDPADYNLTKARAERVEKEGVTWP